LKSIWKIIATTTLGGVMRVSFRSILFSLFTGVKIKKLNSPHPSKAPVWAVLFCLVLVAVPMFAQAFHVHRGDLAGETRQCSVCQVAHAGLQPVLIVPLLVTFKLVAFLPALAAPEAKCGLASFSLFCRPPPVA